MSTTITELGLRIPGPDVAPEDVARLVAILSKADDWLTSREIAAQIGPPANERSIRAAASAACPQVLSYPGSPGYKLMSRCTVQEIQHAIAAFQSQGNEMLKRAVLINRAYHSRQLGASGLATRGEQSTFLP
jgi:hypothetical protein